MDPAEDLRRRITLLEGLKLLFNIKAIDFTTSNISDMSEVRLVIGSSKVIITFNQLMAVEHLKLESSLLDVDTDALLAEAKDMKSPQDLRYIVSYINSANERSGILQKHISELKRHFLVKQISSSILQVSLSATVIAMIRVHDCYPDRANSVFVDSIYDNNQLSNDKMRSVCDEVNAIVIGSIMDAVMFMKKELL